MRILFATEDMHRTASTLFGVAGELTGSGGRIMRDAWTVMPPSAAADAAATVTRVEQRLASVGARYVEQSADLTRRAIAAEIGEHPTALAEAKRIGAFLTGYHGARGERRFFSGGRFNLGKWILGGHRWGYRNGLKSQLRRDWHTLRGIAHMERTAWNALAADVQHEAKAVGHTLKHELGALRREAGAVGRTMRMSVSEASSALRSSVRETSAMLRGLGRLGAARFVARAAGRLVAKVAIPWSLYTAYKDSKATSPLGRMTSAALQTAVGLVPVVAVADIVTDGGATGSLDLLIATGEGLATGDGSDTRASDAVLSGKYGRMWQGYERFVIQHAP